MIDRQLVASLRLNTTEGAYLQVRPPRTYLFVVTSAAGDLLFSTGQILSPTVLP